MVGAVAEPLQSCLSTVPLSLDADAVNQRLRIPSVIAFAVVNGETIHSTLFPHKH